MRDTMPLASPVINPQRLYSSYEGHDTSLSSALDQRRALGRREDAGEAVTDFPDWQKLQNLSTQTLAKHPKPDAAEGAADPLIWYSRSSNRGPVPSVSAELCPPEPPTVLGTHFFWWGGWVLHASEQKSELFCLGLL